MPPTSAASHSTFLTVNVERPEPCALRATPCSVTSAGDDAGLASGVEGQPNGGGFNSSRSCGHCHLPTPLAPGASINLQFVSACKGKGTFRVAVYIERLP